MNQLIRLDNQTDKKTDEYYDEALAYIRDHLLQFYQQYADKNRLSIAQASARVSTWDLKQWQQAISQMDMSDWPEEATIRAKAYGAMAGINKSHMLTAIIGLGLLGATTKTQRTIITRTSQDGKAEIKRMKKAYKLTSKQAKKVSSVITDPSNTEQWSSRLWSNHDGLANDVENLVNQYLKHGASLVELQDGLAKHANKDQFKPRQSLADRIAQERYNTQRIVRTESARLVDEVDMTTFRMQKVTWITWLAEPTACSLCAGIASGGPYHIDDVPSIPGDTHPNCRCIKVPFVANELLPNFEKATIPTPKIRDYVLNFGSLKGKDKARVFKSALGYTKADYQHLIDNIYANVGKFNAVQGTTDKWGTRYSVDIPLKGPNGQRHKVRTAWMVNEKGIPRLISLYVKEKKR